MGRAQNKLTPRTVQALKEPGYYGDGGGLWLQISRTGTKSWLFRFSLHGKSREMGLGAVYTVSLAEARVSAAECRKLLLTGTDPIEARSAERQAKRLEAAQALTFDECVTRYLESHRSGWKNAKHADQWANTLAAYASPVIGKLPVATIDTALVMRVVEPLWTTKTETATRLRGRIENVLSWATVRGYRKGENPARWRGHLDKLLPASSKVAKVQHHPAMPYADLPAFVLDLREQQGVSARALEFTILTAARSGEVLGATWDEIDFERRQWTVPAARMKAAQEHRVPLSARALKILEEMRAHKRDQVFPGLREGSSLSSMAMLMQLRRMGRRDLTVHGFRSTFRDWAAEQTNYPREVAEMALAHTISNAVEAAYRRGDLFEKRRRVMDDWSQYCSTQRSKNAAVTPIHRKNRTSRDAA
jgi:integrase